MAQKAERLGLLIRGGLVALLFASNNAGATGMPDFSKWAYKTLNDNGITDAKVVETHYPFSFTYCRQGNLTLWRYEEMSTAQLEALQQGKTVQPRTPGEKTVQVESNSSSCAG